MSDLQELVEFYVAQLSGASADDARHSLVELGPAALTHIVAAFSAAAKPEVRVALARVVAEYRSTESVPFLASLLRRPDSATWKVALDGLVSVGGADALEELWAAKRKATPPLLPWIDEAIEQTSAALHEAAERGDAEAQFDLAGGSDDEEAVEWYRKAAEQGHADSQLQLAWRYMGAGGVTPDSVQAALWLGKAAEQGHTEAQRLLGRLFAAGDGVPQDDEQAVAWVLKAAEHGNAQAQFDLGGMYYVGRRVSQDDVQAAIWMCKAAEHGNDFLRYRLATRYADGSAAFRAAIERVMAPEQLAKLRKRVQGWAEGFEGRHEK